MTQELLFKIIGMILVTFTSSVLLIPFMKKVAFKVNALDVPGGRHIHKKITPKLGGVAIFFSFLLGYMLFGTHSSIMNAVLISSFIIILLGVFDDIVELGPLAQFIGQLIASSIIVFYGGLLIKNLDIAAFNIFINFGWLSYPLTIFFILGCINCINLIDGLDGLSGGICSIYYLTVGIIAIIQGKTGLDFVLAFTMLGSTIGFLVYNFNPASIFAGDAGSNFMGFMVAVIALLGFKNVTMTSFIIPLIIIAIPILDTLFAIIRRFLKHQPLFKGDKYHIHHQLLNRNFSVKQTVFIIYIIDALFAFASILYILQDGMIVYVVYGLLLLIVMIVILKTNIVFDKDYIKQRREQKK